MKGSIFGHSVACSLLGIWLIASPTHLASASSNQPLAGSLASNLVQSRAQVRIFRHDDQVDLGCQNRSFVRSNVVKQPRVTNQTLNERKWVERWSLNRCGREVYYHVFFTVVGDGGAYYAFEEVGGNEVGGNHSYQARTLQLQKPLMKGGDVRALQLALIDRGFKVAKDGVFGRNTREALAQYQKRKGLTADGIAGPATSASLGL